MKAFSSKSFFKISLLATFLASGPALAEFTCLDDFKGPENPCNIGHPVSPDPKRQISSTPLPESVSYFSKPIPGTNFTAVISESGNMLLDRATGKTQLIQGAIDPVPSPDGKFITVTGGSDLRFIDVKADGSTRVAHQDRDVKVTYQSVGKTGKNHYRILVSEPEINQNGLVIRDYETEFSDSGLASVKKIRTKKICKNQRLQLPMISKDGSKLAAFDLSTQTTKIFEIEPENGECQEIKDLGIATGKVEFSPDGKRVAFHVSNQYGVPTEFDRPYRGDHLNSFVVDLDTDTIYPVSNETDGHAYYPAFLEDSNTVMMMYQRGWENPYGADFDYDAERSPVAIVVNRVSEERGVSIRNLTGACDTQEELRAFQSAVILGKLWSEACLKQDVNESNFLQYNPASDDYELVSNGMQQRVTIGDLTSATSAYLRTLSFNPTDCRTLVDQCWDELNSKMVQKKDGSPLSWMRFKMESIQVPANATQQAYSSTSAVYGEVAQNDFSLSTPGQSQEVSTANYLGSQQRPVSSSLAFLRKEDLLAACPKDDHPRSNQELASKFERKLEDPKDIYEKYVTQACASCHSAEGPLKIDFLNTRNLLKAKTRDGSSTLIQAMIMRMNSNESATRMPPGGVADYSRHQTALDHLHNVSNAAAYSGK